MDDFNLPPNPDFAGVSGSVAAGDHGRRRSLPRTGGGLSGQRGRSGDDPESRSTPGSRAEVRMELAAHGPAVGLPDEGDMGNSEVGHNAMGAGRIFAQGAKLVADAIASGAIFEGPVWRDLSTRSVDNDGTLPPPGPGLRWQRPQSHRSLEALVIRRLAAEGVGRIRIHALADGRDVDPVSFHRLSRASRKRCSRSSKTRAVTRRSPRVVGG